MKSFTPLAFTSVVVLATQSYCQIFETSDRAYDAIFNNDLFVRPSMIRYPLCVSTDSFQCPVAVSTSNDTLSIPVSIDSRLVTTSIHFQKNGLFELSRQPGSAMLELVFLFPFANEAQHPFQYSGMEQEVYNEGGVEFSQEFSGLLPTSFGSTQLFPGHNYSITTIQVFGDYEDFLNITVRSKNNFFLDYTNDSGPSPIGLFIIAKQGLEC